MFIDFSESVDLETEKKFINISRKFSYSYKCINSSGRLLWKEVLKNKGC